MKQIYVINIISHSLLKMMPIKIDEQYRLEVTYLFIRFEGPKCVVEDWGRVILFDLLGWVVLKTSISSIPKITSYK